ncbi:FAD/NAD(P)-binding oxidoreductase [Amycolatopsis sp. NPDC051373]|uniref:NAD(P)/FAD-dependent oxidoreductase n=1 Tax=Amycolatopsis sp. NPDC051373 TaxID=3155801 RepID=UPI00344E153F
MTDETLVVIGSGPAGITAARAYREAGGRGRVRVVSADPDPPYARPPLSKDFLRGESGEPDLALDDPGPDVELVLGDPVAELGEHEIRTESGVFRPFTRCVLATGAEPVRPPIPGADHPDVCCLRSLTSSRELRAAAGAARSAVVVGAGFIGCEAAVSLSRLGVQVTMLCPDSVPQRQRLGRDAGELILHWLKSEGVSVLRETPLDAVTEGHRVHTGLVSALDTDLILLATGVRPRVELAEKAGLTVENGRVRTDQRLRTSRPDVYAAGDIALAYNPPAGRALAVEHWGEGLAMGEVAGRSAAGAETVWDAVPGFWSEIGDHVLKYAAWGDGFDDARPVSVDGGFTVWYERRGTALGVLTYNADEDYERGTELIREHRPIPLL